MLSLMIVDDSNIIRRKIERCDDSDKFRVVASAANGAEAFDYAGDGRHRLHSTTHSDGFPPAHFSYFCIIG